MCIKQEVVTFYFKTGAETFLRVVEYDSAYVLLSQDQPTIAAHSFTERMKLEAVDPAAPISIRPATVTKVTDFLYQICISYVAFSPPFVVYLP